jgi:antitoxin (DNA-binding transcriptional repressor) of toxin-antitoxin stability system
MDQVAQTHEPLTITKHSVPVARLVPVEKESTPLFGYLRDSVKVNGDIVGPIDEAWDAEA